MTKGEALITTDVGQHQMWAAQYYHYTKPRTFLSSGGLGTMGYGLGACIGAQVGQPDKICISNPYYCVLRFAKPCMAYGFSNFPLFYARTFCLWNQELTARAEAPVVRILDEEGNIWPVDLSETGYRADYTKPLETFIRQQDNKAPEEKTLSPQETIQTREI